MAELTFCQKVNACCKFYKSYFLMFGIQLGSAGMFVITMTAFNKGMSHYVFVVYRNTIATIALAPLAYFLERNIRPKMTVRVFSEIMALAFVEVTLGQCFSFLGMKLTSASFASAVMNSVPSITFLLALIFQLEGMKIKEIACQGKVIGTMVSLGGALLMVLYKGPVLGSSAATQMHQPENVNDPTGAHWLLGALFLVIGCVGISAFYILQATSLRKYPANMSLATWVCFVGALQSTVVTIVMERKHPETWSLGLDSRLFAPVYAGIVTSSIQYYVQGYVIKATGPVFVTAFTPLRMIAVTALACIFLKEKLHLGSIVGGLVVVIGLYLVVWGKSKEQRAMASDESQGQQQLPIIVPRIDVSSG
ncbi:WAT1-related protein At4g08290 [Medicago truncatula]|uniref:WAT1-related protein n=1 Tax=Medicago truncatula TaxID=3880 RepID=A0A072THR5_MEDTR|nr:WAT1-related protein At4g08290 [Medicago truncatula]KEH16771.1 nodulin MtN21/EamA-like transporter family protein [Medicago truncatula]